MAITKAAFSLFSLSVFSVFGALTTVGCAADTSESTDEATESVGDDIVAAPGCKPACTDTDNGDHTSTAGSVSVTICNPYAVTLAPKYDFCILNGLAISEYTCVGSKPAIVQHDCANGCINTIKGARCK